MNFKNTFCSSPWFHMRITSDGTFNVCRWAEGDSKLHNPPRNIKTTKPEVFFKDTMAAFRKKMINSDGSAIGACSKCYKMERYGKVSGRQRQLLKSGIRLDENYEKTLASSPWLNEFKKTQNNNSINLMPQDWQIDLGNLCNSGCIMCSPVSSSFLETEFKKINILEKKQPKSWVNDPVAVDNFLECIDKSPKISYMHFIGGEPLINPAFKTILSKLVETGLSKNITIGFTTNITVWDESLIEIFKYFHNINVGLSIECLHPVNDYIRYGSNISKTKEILNKWKTVSNENNWLVQIRTTPTAFSIEKLYTIYEYAWKNKFSVESCDFLEEPKFLRPSVLPQKFKKIAIANLNNWIDGKTEKTDANISVENSRNPDSIRKYLLEDAKSYVNYLKNSEDESYRLPDLVEYISKLEKSRNNSILDYLPHYEFLFENY